MPMIEAVEIVNKEKHFTLCKRDTVGKFFALKPSKDGEDQTSIIKVASSAESITRSPVIYEFHTKDKDWEMLKHKL